jgi:pentose-5-phosphate-3-epimerase
MKNVKVDCVKELLMYVDCHVVVDSCQDYVCPYIIKRVENINIGPESCYYDQEFRTCVMFIRTSVFE